MSGVEDKVETGAAAEPERKAGAHALAIFASMIVSTSFIVGEATARELDPAVMMAIRFCLAAALFMPYVAWRGGLRLPSWRSLLGYLTIGATLAGFFWGMFEALRFTSALNTGAISTVMPGCTAIFGALLVGERLGAHRLAALGLGMVGALWVIFRGDPDRLIALDVNQGDIIFFGACVLYGLYGPLIKRFHRGEPVYVMSFWVMASAAFWLLLVSNTKLWTTDWGGLDPRVFGGIAWLAIGPTITTFFLVQLTTLQLGPTRVQAYLYLVPAFVLVMDWALGKGWPPLMTLPGIGIVLIASVVIQRGAIIEGGAPAPAARR